MCLCYNKDRSYMGEFPLDAAAAELFGDRFKIYAEGKVKNGLFYLHHEVEEQDW